MEYFLIRYDSRVIIYDRRGFIRLATGNLLFQLSDCILETCMLLAGVRFH